jgi:hypothetical protein
MDNNHAVILKEQAQLATEESLSRTLFAQHFQSNSTNFIQNQWTTFTMEKYPF